MVMLQSIQLVYWFCSTVRYSTVGTVGTVGSTNLVLQYGTVSTVRYGRVGRVDTTSSCLKYGHEHASSLVSTNPGGEAAIGTVDTVRYSWWYS